MTRQTTRRIFLTSAAVLWGGVGTAKIVSGLGRARVLAVSDPVMGLSFGKLLLIIGAAELALASLCLLRPRSWMTVAIVAWMASSILVYRLGLSWMHWHQPCGCLGSLTDALHIPPQRAASIAEVLLAYLLVGSYGLLLWSWLGSRGGACGEHQRGSSTEPEAVRPAYCGDAAQDAAD